MLRPISERKFRFFKGLNKNTKRTGVIIDWGKKTITVNIGEVAFKGVDWKTTQSMFKDIWEVVEEYNNKI